ncbi:hypothetical protein NC651_022737 [Populus alba x Populus x berolinensis]|nr:hypothetical protein NC651_022734 [Populus alba x Populus x berolinensis]KAJ6896631.1 hypothetical protein NC651_022737 [Populus alba x Populus x berolinensis]
MVCFSLYKCISISFCLVIISLFNVSKAGLYFTESWSNMQVIFLMTKAGVSERNIAKAIALGPELLGCSIVNKLEINLKYLLSLGIRHRQLGEMIADFPVLLRYNIDLLRPKYKYLRRTMVRPLQDLIEFPRFFSYSLDDRIIPRHKVLVENRINFKLRYMLASTDEEFQKKVEAAVERRRKFESGLMGDNSQASDTDSSEEETDVQFPETEIIVSSSPKTRFNFNSLGSGDSEDLN